MTRTTGLHDTDHDPMKERMANVRIKRTVKGRAQNTLDGGPDYKQRKFVREYLKDCNATQAAIRAGYSPRSAQVTGPGLLEKHRARIELLLEEKLQKVDIDAEAMVQEMAKIAMVNSQDLFDEEGRLIPIQELPRHVAAAISSLEVEIRKEGRGEDAESYTVKKIRLWDKKGSIETLMKYLGLLVEKKTVSNPDGSNLIPSEITHHLDLSNLTEEKLNALLTLTDDLDVDSSDSK